MKELFIEAKQFWFLEAVYAVVARIKGRELTAWEEACIRGLLCGHNPKFIASQIGWKASALRTELSRRIYPYLSQLFDEEEKDEEEKDEEEKIEWNKVPRLFEREGYKYPPLKILKRDLLNLELVSDRINNRQIIRATKIINSVEKLLEKNDNSPVKNLNGFSKLEVENLTNKGDESSKQEDFINALNFYRKALMINPSLIFILVKIASCYHKLKLYKNSFFICDFALSLLEKSQNESYLKSRIYNFLGEIFRELASENYQEDYIMSAFLLYQQARYYSPDYILPVWNIAYLFISAFKNYPLTSKEYNYHVERAKSALDDFKSAASRPESNFQSNRKEIIADAERAFEGLSEPWQKEFYELKQL